MKSLGGGVGIVFFKEGGIDLQWDSLWAVLLVTLLVDAGVHRDAVDPSAERAFSLEGCPSHPEAYECLLKQVGSFVGIFGKEVAHRIDGGSLLAHHLLELAFRGAVFVHGGWDDVDCLPIRREM